MYHNFIGIDIGKSSFFVAQDGKKIVKEYANGASGFTKFFQSHKSVLKQGFIVLETTGGYEMALIRFLQKKRIAVHRANTRKVKNFIRSFGQLGKSDTIDALALAHYGAERHEKLTLFADNPVQRLMKLVLRRNELKRMAVQEKNRLQAPEQEALKASFQAILKVIDEQVQKLDEQIEAIYKEDNVLQEKREILKSVQGIGDIIATQLLALLPEIGKANRRQIASLAGVAPHPNESGTKIGYRFTRGGRAEVKRILFIAAMSAARTHSRLKDFYQRLIKAGKKKMVALTALMRKILVIANARLKEFYDNKAIQST